MECRDLLEQVELDNHFVYFTAESGMTGRAGIAERV